MDPIVAEMIRDATTVVDGAIAAGDELASYDTHLRIDPVGADEQGNYKSTGVRELDLLRISLPNTGMVCQFILVVRPGTGRHNSPTYVVTQQGELRLARFIGDRLVLDPVDDATTTWLASHVHEALPS